jgi:hypothetical protein
MTVHIICVAYQRPVELQTLINCFILQSSRAWVLHIVYDGAAPDDILKIVNPFIDGDRKDERVRFYQSAERYQKYGHPNRRAMLQSIKCDPKDFILMTNDDNYHIVRSIEFITGYAKNNTGLIFWDTVHSHMAYNLHISEIGENHIDMAAFAVRADIAQKTGFNYDHFSADGSYCVECANNCKRRGLKIVKVNKPLLVHN